MQFEVLVRMRESVMGYERRNLRQLCGFRTQEFFSRRRIKEEIANGNCCARRHSGFFHFEQLATGDLDARARHVVGLSRLQCEPRDRTDRWQRFTAKS